MLRFLAILAFAAAIFTTLTGQSIARSAPVTGDGPAFMAVMSAFDDGAIGDSDGCDHCPCEHGRCCPASACCCASCSLTLARLTDNLPVQAFERSSEGGQPEERDLSSLTPPLDPPVPRSSI